MKEIHWLGDSYKRIKAFPRDARQDVGYQLDKVQRGQEPDDWKPMSSVGLGVREIRVKEVSGAFRVIYVLHQAHRIYVLHAFQKKTQKTRKQDIDLARDRLQMI